MEWWFIPIGLGLAALARLLWVAALHSGETVSSVPELDGYVPGDHSTRVAVAPKALSPRNADAGDGSASAPIDVGDGSASAPLEPDDGPDPAAVDDSGPPDPGVGDGEIWIELDIEPLFSSSQTSRLVDLTEDPEASS